MAKQITETPETQFYKLSDKVKKQGYSAIIDNALIEVLAESYNYRWLANGARQVSGIDPARGRISKSGRIISETIDGFVDLTPEQMWQLANAGVITLSTKQERGHIAAFKEYIKKVVPANSPTDY